MGPTKLIGYVPILWNSDQRKFSEHARGYTSESLQHYCEVGLDRLSGSKDVSKSLTKSRMRGVEELIFYLHRKYTSKARLVKTRITKEINWNFLEGNA